MKYICRIEIELTTPLHCGGGSGESDQPVVRDTFGHYMIPGSSLAGILRHLSHNVFGEQKTAVLFGAESAGSEEGHGSRVQTSDACLIDLNNKVALEEEIEGRDADFPVSPIIRDHVKLNPESGVAEEGGKFDEELVPPLTRFAFEIALITERSGEDSDEFIQNYLTLLSFVVQEQLAFGGGYTRGLGAYRLLSCDCRFFDFSVPESMKAYLNLSRGLRFTKNDGGEKIEIPTAKQILSTSESGFSGSLTMNLISNGPLLVGGSSDWQTDADMTCSSISIPDYDKKTFGTRFIIPGSSIKGALRSRVWHICSHLGHNSDAVIDDLFGTVEKDKGKRGKIRINDILLPETAVTKEVQHVAIDRFTGGALDSALFNEAPIWMGTSPSLAFSCSVSGLTPLEAGLFAHAILDLAEGRLPVGGGVNRGNGRLLLQGLKVESPVIGEEHLSGMNLNISKDRQESYLAPDDLHLLKQWCTEIDTALNRKGENHG